MDIECLKLYYLKITTISSGIKIRYMNLIISGISERMFFTKNFKHVYNELVFYTPLSI